jgi:menaquinone-specific isochorismate synthase
MWSTFPSALFVFPRLQWTHVNGQSWLTVNQPVMDGDLHCAERILTEERERLESLAQPMGKSDVSEVIDVRTQPLLSNAEWNHMAGEAIQQIRRGDLEKVVLARGVDVHLDQPIDPIGVLALLEERYPECTRFLIEPAHGQAFLGATPETLAALAGGELRTIALAGSTRRGSSSEEDDLLAQTLMDSPKERHEHALVVEAIRSRLAPLVDELAIEEQPGLWRLSNIQHLRTHALGVLHDEIDILDVIEALHPTPALGGTPRGEALALIEELEPTSRGWYASPVGWMDANGDGEFAVAIRSAVTAGAEARLYAGAGIVADSDPQREWDETALKLRPMLEALRGKL